MRRRWLLLPLLAVFVILRPAWYHQRQDSLLKWAFEGIDAVLWINLDRNLERYHARLHDVNLLQEGGINVERIQAIDGMDDDVMMHFESERRPEKSDVEYACLLSHLKAIQRFHRSNWSTIVILEDDVSFELSKYWNQSIRTVLDSAPSDWGVLKLSYMTLDPMDRVKRSYSAWNGTWSTLAYAINRSGANSIMSLRNKTSKRWTLPPANSSFHEADWVLFTTARTYVYKLPFFIWSKSRSDIHPDHMQTQNKCRDRLLQVWENPN